MEKRERTEADEHAVMQVTQKAILISSDHKVLLLQASDGVWELPGGRININETWEEALRREVFEETGLRDFTLCGVVGVGNWQSKRSRDSRYGVFFCCTVDDIFIPRLSSEHVAYTWIKEKDLDYYTFPLPLVAQLISKALCI